jgi:hypothetical protein
MAITGASPALYKEDLDPAKIRNWSPFSIFNVWTSDVHSLWGYYLAASLFLFCGGFVLIAFGIGSLIFFPDKPDRLCRREDGRALVLRGRDRRRGLLRAAAGGTRQWTEAGGDVAIAAIRHPISLRARQNEEYAR